MRRLTAVLLALVAVLGIGVSAPQPAAAGPIGSGVELLCDASGAGTLTDLLGDLMSEDTSGVCEYVGSAIEKKANEAWKAVWDSVLGDVINSARDVGKWVIKKTLTTALLGPSLDLEHTGLWSGKATLAGMLVWLGLVIAAFGMMWQLGKMALTGQIKYAGQALSGWVQNAILSAVGVGMVALMLKVGDAFTKGLVDATFDDDGQAYERIISVMLPNGVSNPITMLCVVAILLLLGFVQLVMIFLRQSAIPIQCLLLPVAGAGRVGGDATRQWAPRLITSIIVVGAYKPMVAIIICTGFAEFGEGQTLADWLRGCATLILAVVAPGPLIRVFAPFGEAIGAGLNGGGATGAVAAAGTFFAGRASSGGDGGDATAEPANAVDHARYVEQSMGQQGGAGDDGTPGGDAQAQASRNDAAAALPGQGGPADGSGGPAGASGAPGQSGATGAAGASGSGGGAAGGGGAGIAITVLDGVNGAIQGASGQIGDGGNQQ